MVNLNSPCKTMCAYCRKAARVGINFKSIDMAKSSRPANAPSTTTKPSGKGRGNNTPKGGK